MKTISAIGLASALLIGCATPTTGVISLPDGLHKVAHQGSGAWVTTASLKAQASQEADLYCNKSGKSARVLDVKETQARPMGGWPEAEVLFRCE